MKKKILALILTAFAALLLLSGCGEGGAPINYAEVPVDESAEATQTLLFATDIPQITLTPEATQSVDATESPEATASAKTTAATPKATATVKPTATPKPTATIKPTETPKATATPKPTATVKPTATPKVTATPTPKATATVTPKPTTATPKPTATAKPNLSFEEEVVELCNEIRAEYGLGTLTLNSDLSDVARAKSQDMHDKGYFSHQSPTYGSPFDMMKTFGISYRTAGENIAMGYTSPKAVVDAWMNSEGHRANILNASFTQIGVGYVKDGNYWTQMFIG